ncbi:peroxidase [Neisseria arctica]|uniref:Peroxidase n=1 Tax=Neisseria arctica TaxID=1470200 RepID=A0A0J1C2G5_9NEIS|nr:Dyp-type peroxidase [Neisseria arctica]KLT72428.1 peroxidase [Neisseria arctica]UOO85998.1 Dyp-type peroxidase [Neisseria arctica]
MSTPQSAILPDHCKAGIFIEADVVPTQEAHLKKAAPEALDALAKLQTQYPEAALGLTIAFGSDLWKSFGHSGEGSEIKPFRPLGNGLAPATQHDVMFHIQSLRPDVNFSLAMSLLEIFGDSIKVADETHGFRWIEERGLEGFIDGTENPQGDEEITQVGTIATEEPGGGGSYVLLQKYRHDLKKWNTFDLNLQEDCVGRSKAENEEFEGEKLNPRAHIARTNLKENGVGLKIVRRSLPYGTASGEHGLMFIAYCGRLYNIEAQLLSMFGETDGKTDLLLEHVTTAVSGAYYYAPSVERMRNL